jgi:TRAP-type mannitol/chloroaromatic compound transport system substrate-binding protein
MPNIKRRDFLKKATAVSLVGGSGLIFGCGSGEQKGTAPAIQTGKTYQWKMVTTWSPHFPVLGEGADLIAKWIDEMSGGRLQIQVYGGNELVPPLETFDAVSVGTAQMGHGAAYYWAGKAPASQFFSAVPFGMNAQQMNSWIYDGGGLPLWEELYAPFNLLPMPAGNTGVQMGGWFNREIDTTDDLQGLKMRIPGLGGKVIAKAGGSAILSAGGEIYTNLERGVIDATEWIGPYHDYLMGFHKIAKYYYYPGWHEPGSVLELIVNKSAFAELPKDLQGIIRSAAYRANLWILSTFETKNNEYLQKILDEKGVDVRKFPDNVIDALRKYSNEVIEEITASDAMSKKVYNSFSTFRKDFKKWSDITEGIYYSEINA